MHNITSTLVRQRPIAIPFKSHHVNPCSCALMTQLSIYLACFLCSNFATERDTRISQPYLQFKCMETRKEKKEEEEFQCVVVTKLLIYLIDFITDTFELMDG